MWPVVIYLMCVTKNRLRCEWSTHDCYEKAAVSGYEWTLEETTLGTLSSEWICFLPWADFSAAGTLFIMYYDTYCCAETLFIMYYDAYCCTRCHNLFIIKRSLKLRIREKGQGTPNTKRQRKWTLSQAMLHGNDRWHDATQDSYHSRNRNQKSHHSR